jgi:hypothetical protein
MEVVMPALYLGGPALNSDGSFTVRRGDSLSKYSQGIYGDFSHIGEFFKSKGPPPAPIPNPDSIVEGERLYHLPPVKDPAKKLAMERIDAFAMRTGTPAFRLLSRGYVAQGLRERVTDPTRVNQGMAPVCPSANVIYIEAKERPVSYVDFVTGLFEHGQARLGQWTIEPGYYLKNYLPPLKGIHQADWIPMASIRDSENWLFPYANITWRGGAWGEEIATWLSSAGYTDVQDHSSKYLTENEENLRMAGDLYVQGYKIIMVIDANVFLPPPQRPSRIWIRERGMHIVTLTTAITFSGSPANRAVDFRVYTWGGERQMKPDGYLGMLLSDFLGYYYGFVAARL